MRLTPVLSSLILSVNLLAATADLRVTVSGVPAQINPGDTISWSAKVENLGPDAAHDIRFASQLFLGGECTNQRIVLLESGANVTVQCSMAQTQRYREEVSASANSLVDEDPNPNNNLDYRNIDVITPPDLIVLLQANPHVDPGLPFKVQLVAANGARTTATGVTTTMDVTGATITKVPEGCSVFGGTRFACNVGTLTPWVDPNKAEPRRFEIEVLAPDASKTAVRLDAEIHGEQAEADPRSNAATYSLTTFETYTVTNTNDSGGGSLRAAIDSANAACQAADPACKIAFRIEPGQAKWLTIRPASPLPAITAKAIIVDGTTQTRYFGDTNPAGPEIEINGALTTGDGLDVAAQCSASVLSLAINGFPRNGVLLRAGDCEPNIFRNVSGCYIGTDPTGTTAVPNQRGIFVDTQRWPFQINGNVISGNTRAGVFIANGAQTTLINNTIGLNAARTAGLGNGASGIYVAPGGHGADIAQNFIGFNHDSGISIDRDAVQVSATFNSLQANWQLGIDYALDGPSLSVPVMAERLAGHLHAPEITSARYDAASDTTIIEGRAVLDQVSGFSGQPSVEVFANDAAKPNGFAEGQYVLGRASVASNGAFTFRAPGHLPGPWVTATATTYNAWGFLTTEPDAGGGGYATTTSEFSRAMRVSD